MKWCVGVLAGVLAAVLALAGCTVSRTGAPIAARKPSSTTTTTTTTTATTPPAPTAADGANFQACADGTCEIAISGPATIPLPGGSMVVSQLFDDGIEFDLNSASGGGNGSLRGFCTATFGGGGGTMDCPRVGPPDPPAAVPGFLAVQIVGVADGAIVVRIVS